jgi:hypothetical protein
MQNKPHGPVSLGAFRSRARHISIALALTMSLQGCVRWVAQSAPLAEVVSSGRVNRVRVTRPDGSRVEVRHPVVDGEHVLGFTSDGTSEAPFSMSLADVRSVSVGRISVLRTTLLIASVAGVIVLALGAVAMSQLTLSPGCSYSTCSP